MAGKIQAEAPVEVFVALGANVGDATSAVSRAMDELESWSIRPARRSTLWRSAPVDCPTGSAEFVNAAVGLYWGADRGALDFLRRLKQMESRWGRKPKLVLNEPRVLDLDLIAFGDQRCESEELVLPHPRAAVRRFVLEPLAEIAPDLVLHTRDGSIRGRVRELLERLPHDASVRKCGTRGAW